MMTVWNDTSGLKTCGSRYVHRGAIAAPTAPIQAALSANAPTFTRVVSMPRVAARSSSAPIATSA